MNPAIKAAIERIKQQACVILVTGRHHTAAHPYHHELGLNTPTHLLQRHLCIRLPRATHSGGKRHPP
ncbi:hypothetical protein [Dickeya sp. DW 0440]|uniref:hypothetical protein n=1 Tax=Dickeya sp. DW 0440 TaxID=1225785 RepID=UPI002101455B|nr:hypothetical protein [Dickeya sp. DW 0440]